MLPCFSIRLIIIINQIVFIVYFREAREEKPLDNLVDAQKVLGVEKVRLQQARLQLAKKNRAIVSIQRQIDNIPDRTELAQYQRRFLELYNQGALALVVWLRVL